MPPHVRDLIQPLLAAALIAAAFVPTFDARAATLLAGDDLLTALRGGGHVVVFVHTETAGSDRADFDMDDCDTQARLSRKGWQDAMALGRAARAMAVPVFRVHTTPFCRARHVAYLAFGADMTVHDDGLGEACGDSGAAVALRRLVTTPPPRSGNTAAFTHACNISISLPRAAQACGTGPGDAAVFRADGRSGVSLAGCLPYALWTKWRDAPPQAVTVPAVPWKPGASIPFSK